eukprot:CAMPEP_0172298620 /NCGR_PEP_ID=MMETSP1058-20130122/1190_1 /TAXON_ID=83371 /ORGANISM="Detonula confervacea, Strain CCMP 353" /LENGTH=528 /DNA_ID=CAMNT_0013007901 /DNA_START=9 /DNA_END=1591 /DNA_ORIENTATION=-
MCFFHQITTRSQSINSLLCIGLDPHLKELSLPPTCTEEERAEAAYQFCKRIIDATHPHAVCYKPNAAFFEAIGTKLGCVTLRRVVDAIPDGIPVLLDVKRGDIGSTAAAYADACYDDTDGLKADGVTLSPLMGWDSVQPFVTGKYADKGAFVLCKTSNPGSNDLLALTLQNTTLFEKIAHLANEWSHKAQAQSPVSFDTSSSSPRLGLVVGATDPQALSAARKAAGQDIWILAPGVGAQGGDLDAACKAGLNDQGSCMLIPVSRGVSRASDPGAEAQKLKEGINAARSAVLSSKEEKSEQSGSGIAAYQKDFIEFSLKEGVLKFGSFVLKSGRTSPYFFNAGLFSSGSALHKLGKSYAASIMASELVDKDGKVTFDVVFGPAYKGISLGALVCAALYNDFGVDTGFAYNRKEAKDHGEGGILVGASMVKKRVLIVDDVISAGTAIRESYALLEKIEATPVGVSIALDRAEKRSLEDPLSAVQAVARDLGIPVVSIARLPQLQEYLRVSPDYDEDVLKLVTEYRSKYGG